MIPPGEDAAFVASMEHVLDCYQRPLDPEFPVVNMDEQPVRLKADLRDPLELHHTPKHGSWLNIAEIELSVLTRQCLCRQIPLSECIIGNGFVLLSARFGVTNSSHKNDS